VRVPLSDMVRLDLADAVLTPSCIALATSANSRVAPFVRRVMARTKEGDCWAVTLPIWSLCQAVLVPRDAGAWTHRQYNRVDAIRFAVYDVESIVRL
jgi:hypothetical protein